MKNFNIMVWVMAMVLSLGLTGAAVAQSPAPDSPKEAAAPTEVKADVNVTRTTTTSSFDGSTLLIGGALLLGIMLIAVAASSRSEGSSTTVVR